MNDIEDRRLHLCGLKIFVGAEIKAPQRLSKQLRFAHIDRNELENSVLSHNTNNHSTSGLIVDVNERYSTGTSFQHAATCFVKWAKWMY